MASTSRLRWWLRKEAGLLLSKNMADWMSISRPAAGCPADCAFFFPVKFTVSVAEQAKFACDVHTFATAVESVENIDTTSSTCHQTLRTRWRRKCARNLKEFHRVTAFWPISAKSVRTNRRYLGKSPEFIQDANGVKLVKAYTAYSQS